MFFEILMGLAILGAAAAITWAILDSWLEAQRNANTSYAELIKENLRNGNYRVQVGVFNRSGTRTANRIWEGKSIDDELEDKFRGLDEVRIYY